MTINEFMETCKNEWGYICIDGKSWFINDWRQNPVFGNKEISSFTFNSGLNIITKS